MIMWIVLSLLIIAMLLLGGLATIVFVGVCAVAEKRPSGLSWLGGGVLVSLLVFVGAGYFFAAPQQHTWHDTPATEVVTASGPDGVVTVSAAPSQVSSHLAVPGWILIFALGVAFLVLVSHTWKSCQRGEHRGGWFAASLLAALVITLLFVVRSWNSSSRVDVAYHHEQNLPQIENIRVEVKEDHQIASEAADAASGSGQQSMHDVWEHLNKPRIKLEENDAGIEVQSDGGESEEAGDVEEAGEAADNEAAADVTPAVSSQPSPRRRPAWVAQPPKRVGNIWRQVVVAGEYATSEECYESADDLLNVATWHHVQRLMGLELSTSGDNDPRAEVLQAQQELYRMDVGSDYIRREIAKDEYPETVERSVGPMNRLYTLLEFSQSVDRDLRARWEAAEREWRVLAVGTMGGLAVSVLGLAYGVLKVDTWTKGYYTKRLFLGVPAAIIGLIALAAGFVAF